MQNQRIVPVHGTVIDDPIVSNDLFSFDNDEGLVPFSDEEDSEEEDNTPQPVGYQTEAWKPAKGNVGLLTFDVVKALSDHTGCTFSINAHRNEVRLYGGNLSDALSRLSAMEAILVSPYDSSLLSTITDLSYLVLHLPSCKCSCPNALYGHGQYSYRLHDTFR